MKTVMLIDDSEADLLFSQIIVGRSGVCDQVLEFQTAPRALAHLQTPAGCSVDLILLDINMPGMDGFQFLEAMQALPPGACPRPAVVMLTSSPDPRDRLRAEEFGCVRGYLVKPISLGVARQLPELAATPRATQE